MTAGVSLQLPLQAAVLDATETRGGKTLVRQQDASGYWCAELTADSTLESDFILLELWMNAPVDGVWKHAETRRIQKAVEAILARQLPDGGFNIYVEGPL